MRGVNKALILGTLGKDPESRITSGGTQVANFSVAVNESYKDKKTGEKKESTEWLSIVCFGRTAEIAIEYLKKGSKIYIEGRIKTEKYQDKQGVDRYTTKIYCNILQMLDSRPPGTRESGNAPRSGPPPQGGEKSNADYSREYEEEGVGEGNSKDDFDDDIPF